MINVVQAKIQVLKRSDMMPMASRLTSDAPLRRARDSEDAVALKCKEEAYAASILA